MLCQKTLQTNKPKSIEFTCLNMHCKYVISIKYYLKIITNLKEKNNLKTKISTLRIQSKRIKPLRMLNQKYPFRNGFIQSQSHIINTHGNEIYFFLYWIFRIILSLALSSVRFTVFLICVIPKGQIPFRN